MNYAAQPVGTTDDQALANRGEDPLLIAASTYAFFNAIATLVTHQRMLGNRLASPNSVITSLIGSFFIVDDAAVLAGFPASSLPSPHALTELVAFLVHIGCDFAGKNYHLVQELWADVMDSGYSEFLDWLRSTDSNGMAPDPRCILSMNDVYATQPPAGTAAQRNLFAWTRHVSYDLLAVPVGDARGLRRLTGLAPLAYFAGLPTLSLSRDRSASQPVLVLKALLAEAASKGLPGSSGLWRRLHVSPSPPVPCRP